MTFLAQFFLAEFVSGFFKSKKKNPFATKLERGEGGCGRATKKITFFVASLIQSGESFRSLQVNNKAVLRKYIF